MRNLHRRRRSRGFTLIEVLLVLVILVILVSLVVGTYTSAQNRANINAARTQIGLFDTPLGLFYLAMNSYPTTEQGLQALREPPSDLPNPKKWDMYLGKPVPLDPWGNRYQYQCPGRSDNAPYDIWSWGPDKTDGTDDDIGNWLEE